MKITFYSPHLGLRGTEVTMYDYAFYGRKFFGWDIQILYNKNEHRNHPSAIEKFKKEFDLFELNCNPKNFSLVNSEIEKFLDKHPSDYFYMQKGGKNDGINPKNSKTCILACSTVNPKLEKHGNKYAFISSWLSNHCSHGEVPVVPSIVDCAHSDEDLRNDLGIPKEAIVFGRTGGMDTWNLPFVNDAVRDILEKRDDIYFVFQNTPDFLDHERVIHIEPTSDMQVKAKFINTCDALLHARREGESFGLVCGEFSIKNKRVITYRDSPERNHIEILGDKALYFSTTRELFSILNTFKPEPEKDWNCYRDFEPEKVMNIFQNVFIDQQDHFNFKKDDKESDKEIIDNVFVVKEISEMPENLFEQCSKNAFDYKKQDKADINEATHYCKSSYIDYSVLPFSLEDSELKEDAPMYSYYKSKEEEFKQKYDELGISPFTGHSIIFLKEKNTHDRTDFPKVNLNDSIDLDTASKPVESNQKPKSKKRGRKRKI